MIIDNNNIFEQCPCCGSLQVVTVGQSTIKANCKFSTIDIVLRKKPYLNRCRDCDSGFVQNSIRQNEAEHLYTIGDGTKRWAGVDFVKDKTEEVVRLVKDLIAPGINVCDIGCNTGEFLSFAKDLGAHTHGVELSAESVKACEQKGHQIKSDLRNFDLQFDIITAFDVIEHLYDPVGFIEAVASKLKDNGLFVILTGNINSIPAAISKASWWYANYPEHVVFPSRKFYKELPSFELYRYVKTFASGTHKRSGRRVKNIPLLFKSGGNGLPSFFSDHHVIVLKKSAS